MKTSHKIKIAFVCYGNACRSIMAEAILRKLSDAFEVYSAGFSPLGRVPEEVLEVIKNNNMDTSPLFSKGLGDIPVKELSYMIVLDPYVSISEKLVSLMDLPNLMALTWDVKDPYRGTEEDYKETFSFLEDKIEIFLGEVRSKAVCRS